MSVICPYDTRHEMSRVPREINRRPVYLCESLRADGLKTVRCGATLVPTPVEQLE